MMLLRFYSPREEDGDRIYGYLKFLPLYSVPASVFFNKRMLDLL